MKDLKIQINVSSDTFIRDPNSSELGRRIIFNGINLIDELGFESFTFKKLGEKIGSPESSIYRYFESKHMLLVYLTNWYWSWIEYKLVFSTINLSSSKEKLEKAIKILTETIKTDDLFSYVNETTLDRIIMNEGGKVYHIKDVDKENKKGYFKVYMQVVQRVSEIVLELNPKYKFSHMLISTIIEGAYQQRFFAEHIPALTDIDKKNEKTITEFYTKLVFNAIK
ncbi:TetR family transcriptional regulator [Lutibacter profundi]|uniref:TetR family transcriptional regulator n=1 Tax=Lutibacter profundi TaxID=1622118 RepID=A0A0X8G8K7_9FLAO|nr:TetR/AcrR family transcriptional regulator [Lutibacter profundi]AMC12049.1 TetR family transcriptional regulator [Lutibacter profundi]